VRNYLPGFGFHGGVYVSVTSPYRLNVNEQAEKLAQFLARADQMHALGRDLELSSRPRIVFAGMGSSHFASYETWEALSGKGLPTWWLPASELIDVGAGLLTPGTLLCLTSQSGESAEITQVLKQFDLSGIDVMGITNDPESNLAKRSNYLVDLKAGPEATVSTKTYLNSIAALKLVFSAVSNNYESSRNSLLRTVDSIEKYITVIDSQIDAAESIFPYKKNYVCVGRGVAGASSQTAGLILKEAAKMSIEGTTSASFRHGPIEISGPELSVTFFDHGTEPHNALNLKLASDLEISGSSVTWIGDKGVGSKLASPDRNGTDPRICDTLSFQTLSFALAARTGVQAGSFAYASKETDTL
jgi:glucosamine--fructose-6-phosphate aminotransferase (isomerizing)